MEREERFEKALQDANEAGVSMYGPQTAAEDRHLWAVSEPLKYHSSLHDFRPRKFEAELAHPNVTPTKYVPEKVRIQNSLSSEKFEGMYLGTVWDKHRGGIHIPLGNEDRDRSKEVQPPMRFTPRTQAERIEEQAYNMGPRSPAGSAMSPRFPQWVEPSSPPRATLSLERFSPDSLWGAAQTPVAKFLSPRRAMLHPSNSATESQWSGESPRVTVFDFTENALKEHQTMEQMLSSRSSNAYDNLSSPREEPGVVDSTVLRGRRGGLRTRSNLVPDVPHPLDDPWEQKQLAYYRDVHRRALNKKSWVGGGNFIVAGKRSGRELAPPSLAASGHSRGNPFVPHSPPGRSRDKNREMAGTFLAGGPGGYVIGYLPDGTPGKWGTRLLSSGYGAEWKQEALSMIAYAQDARGPGASTAAAARKRLLGTPPNNMEQHHSPRHPSTATLPGTLSRGVVSKLSLSGLVEGGGGKTALARTKAGKLAHLEVAAAGCLCVYVYVHSSTSMCIACVRTVARAQNQQEIYTHTLCFTFFLSCPARSRTDRTDGSVTGSSPPTSRPHSSRIVTIVENQALLLS